MIHGVFDSLIYVLIFGRYVGVNWEWHVLCPSLAKAKQHINFNDKHHINL